MTFISSWATNHRLLIAADTVASDTGKHGYPPIEINVNKIFPISEKIAAISVGTDHFDYEVKSNDTVKMIFKRSKTAEVSEAKNLIKGELEKAFLRYKQIKEQKHGNIFTEIDPTEVTLLYWISEFNFWGCESIKVGVENNKVYSTSWSKRRLGNVEEWGLKGFRNNPQISSVIKEKDSLILQTDDFDKITNTIESLFCFIYKWLRTTPQYDLYGLGEVNIYVIENTKGNIDGRWIRKVS